MFTCEDIVEKARENQVKTLCLQFTDIFGVLKNVTLPLTDLDRALAGQIYFDSSVVDGVVRRREQDIIFLPDISTFAIFPWQPMGRGMAGFVCDVCNLEEMPYQGCSRSVLQQVLDEAAKMGFEILVGADVQFYLFKINNSGKPITETHDRAGFCDMKPVNLGENLRRDILLSLRDIGLDAGPSYHEVGPGQHKIAFKTDNALALADKLVTSKFILRAIARRHGLYASMMPKPLNGRAGSAMIFHVFPCHRGFLREARHFIGGVLDHTRANTAITNPLINSYKRLMTGELTPMQVTWSEDNRNAVLRVMMNQGEVTRVDVRNPDPACNPYLALAVIIKAGLDGIQKQLELPSPQRHDERGALLPRTLGEALSEFDSNQLAKDVLGKYIYHIFAEAKSEEWERFQTHVHPWELQEYLTIS
ncbi:MAG: glutamine synthetase [Firmicutes bacterium]|nr:glutamine synthetase [Bacillota bacterium]